MRYINEDDFVWTDGDNVTHKLKFFRTIPSYDSMKKITTTAFDMLDEIASRQEIYGDGGELDTYKLIEANRTKLIESGFDMAKIKTLEIPG